MPSLQAQLNLACQSIQHAIGVGKVADYIPALARVPADKFGAAIVTVSGEKAFFGDAREPFSIQSISKVFAITAALNRFEQQIWERVGHEPSGNAFNSIVQLEKEHGIPRNPFINARALVVTDALLEGQTTTDCSNQMLELVQLLADDDTIAVDNEVAQSERDTSHRNAGLAHFMRSFGRIENSISDVLDVYCRQCAIAMSCEQLARSTLYLANNGTDPITETHIVNEERGRRINAMMMLCGHYDASGDFAHRVGLPGKSGVGGGIVVVVPDVAAVAVWAPRLNANGNSHAGTAALEALVRATKWNVL
ncbi:glutaminase [Chromatiales bacterium (ex Bugula neritina AB1)]|nr:glutaminase [Chromatiales bacterium (ex Bugula neritina AB1)]